MIYLVTGQQEMFTPVGYSMASVDDALAYLKTLEVIGYDSETEGFDPYTCGLISIQLGDQEKQFVIDARTVNISLFKELLETKELIIHNAKFNLRFLYHKKIVPSKIFDSFLVERILTTGIDTGRSEMTTALDRKFR